MSPNIFFTKDPAIGFHEVNSNFNDFLEKTRAVSEVRGKAYSLSRYPSLSFPPQLRYPFCPLPYVFSLQQLLDSIPLSCQFFVTGDLVYIAVACAADSSNII